MSAGWAHVPQRDGGTPIGPPDDANFPHPLRSLADVAARHLADNQCDQPEYHMPTAEL
jgi:hypothetical protein